MQLLTHYQDYKNAKYPLEQRKLYASKQQNKCIECGEPLIVPHNWPFHTDLHPTRSSLNCLDQCCSLRLVMHHCHNCDLILGTAHNICNFFGKPTFIEGITTTFISIKNQCTHPKQGVQRVA